MIDKYNIALEMNLFSNMWGALRDDVRNRLQGYIDSPSVEAWDDVHGILLFPNLTFWQALLECKPEYTTMKGRATDLKGNVLREWSRYPSRDDALATILYVAYKR